MHPRIVALDCTVQTYAWGSQESIPKLLGKPNPNGEPWAELWMGAHHKAPSTVPDGRSLADYIAERPAERLGGTATSLPFLFKILAADGPLSIQCHPNKAQAEAGFAREEEAQIAIDAPHRNYRDANHKPELIVALEEFWALKGFRSPEQIASLMRVAGIRSLESELNDLLGHGGLKPFFAALLGLDAKATQIALGELSKGLDALPPAEARWSSELLARYPTDQGALAALVLQLVRLEPGEALYLGAGELHAYLRGTGLEIMANSDNVLRGGLTPKHVDVAELLRVLRFEHKPVEVLAATGVGAIRRFSTPCPEFSLGRAIVAGQPIRLPSHQHAQIVLCLGAGIDLSSGDDTLALPRGGVAFVSAGTEIVAQAHNGTAQLWLASFTAGR